MQKKYLLPVILFLLGLTASIIGSLFKIMHWAGAPSIFIFGMLTLAASFIVLIFVLLKSNKS